MVGNKTLFAEDFESVDVGLTPDPFTSITESGGNDIFQAAVGVGNGAKCTLAGTATPCYGSKSFTAIPFSRGPIIFTVGHIKVVESGHILNQNFTFFEPRSASSHICRLQWKTNADLTSGKLQVVAGFGAALTTTGTTNISENTAFSINICIKKSGLILVYLNGGVTPEISQDNAGAPPDLTAIRVGVTAASSVPLAGAEVHIDNIRLSQLIPGGDSGSSIIGLGDMLGRIL